MPTISFGTVFPTRHHYVAYKARDGSVVWREYLKYDKLKNGYWFYNPQSTLVSRGFAVQNSAFIAFADEQPQVTIPAIPTFDGTYLTTTTTTSGWLPYTL